MLDLDELAVARLPADKKAHYLIDYNGNMITMDFQTNFNKY